MAEVTREGARREAAEARACGKKVLPVDMEAQRETLGRLPRMLWESAKYALLAVAAARLEDASRPAQVAALQRTAPDDKLAMYRQQAAAKRPLAVIAWIYRRSVVMPVAWTRCWWPASRRAW